MGILTTIGLVAGVIGLTIILVALLGNQIKFGKELEELRASQALRPLPGGDRVDSRIEITMRGNDIFARTDGAITPSGLALASFLLFKKALELGGNNTGNVTP